MSNSSDDSFDEDVESDFASVENYIVFDQSFYSSTAEKAKRIIMVDSRTVVMLLEGPNNLMYAMDKESRKMWRVAGKARLQSDSDSDSESDSNAEGARAISFNHVQDIAWDEDNNRILILDAGAERLLALVIVEGRQVVEHVAWIHSRQDLLHGMTFVAPGVLMFHHYHGVSTGEVEGNRIMLVDQPEENFVEHEIDMATVVAMPNGGVFHIDLSDGWFRYCEGPNDAGVWNFQYVGGQESPHTNHVDGRLRDSEFCSVDAACPVYVDGEWKLLVSDYWRLRLISRNGDNEFKVQSVRWNIFGRYPDVSVDRSRIVRGLRRYGSARISAMIATEDGSVVASIFDDQNRDPHIHGVIKIDGFDPSANAEYYAGSVETVQEAEASHRAQQEARRKRRMSESPEKGMQSKTRMELRSKLIF